MATRREIIRKKALELLESAPDGIRYSELVDQILAAYPDFPRNTINGNVWNLDSVLSDQIYKAARGLFRSTKFKETEPEPKTVTSPPPTVWLATMVRVSAR